jgi:TPR repeat protein
MALEPGEVTCKPVGMTDDPEAATTGDKDRSGGQTHSDAKKNKRAMKELEEEEHENGDDDDESEAKSMKSEKKKKKKHRGRETGKVDSVEEEEKTKKQKKTKKRKTKTNEKKTKKRKTDEQLCSEDSPPMSALSWPDAAAAAGVGSSGSNGENSGQQHTEADRAQAPDDADRRAAVDDEEGEWGSDDDDDEDEEITEAEFQQVIAAIQRVRLATLQLDVNTAARLGMGHGDVGDRTTRQRTYEMDWAKAVQTYKRYVSPLVVDIDANGASRARTRSLDDAKAKTKTKQTVVPWRGSIKIKPRWERIASYNLGLCYYNGQGIEQDLSVAAQLFQRAADMGHVNGINSLGTHFSSSSRSRGTRTPVPPTDVIRPLTTRRFFGSTAGLCYYRGQGVVLNIDKALSLFKLAADRGECSRLCLQS